MTGSGFRTVSDSLGELEVPEDALWGAQTQRALENFPVSDLTLPDEFIQALALVKWAAAGVNMQLGLLTSDKGDGIQQACEEIIAGGHREQFPVDVFQTGSGTSTNMNANEVIATLASQYSGVSVHPNDDVNRGQSSNDVIPTSIHVSAVLAVLNQLLPGLAHLEQTIATKAESLSGVIKTGRTHLMDAMPVSFGQELSAWAAQIRQAQQSLEAALPRVQKLAQGGTAVGSGVNAHPKFAREFAQCLSRRTGVAFEPRDDLFAALASQDAIVELSGVLRVTAVAITKIANDLRWMNSGPLAGFGEIKLPALQPGSSIMPGKVNPVIPESVAMVAAQVIGNDVTITMAGQSGNFQLNVMLPVIAHNVLQSVKLLANASRLLADKAIADFEVCTEHVNNTLNQNPILVTALNPIIGYEQGAVIAKRAYKEGRSVLGRGFGGNEFIESGTHSPAGSRSLDPRRKRRSLSHRGISNPLKQSLRTQVCRDPKRHRAIRYRSHCPRDKS